jgi:heme/copper-type cytochrome/quinol oxidase subunit 2
VLAVTAAIFVVVSTLLAYSVLKFRKRNNDDGREPPQVYGSNQIEVAWTVIPMLMVAPMTQRSVARIHPGNQPHQLTAARISNLVLIDTKIQPCTP